MGSLSRNWILRVPVSAWFAALTLFPAVLLAGRTIWRAISFPTPPAATIAQLADEYTGRLYSNKDVDFQDIEAFLDVETRTRSRFTGAVTLDVAEPDILLFPGSGTVSAAGKVSFIGKIDDPDMRLTVTLNGQLSASGRAIIGNYRAAGRDADGRVNEVGTFSIFRAP